MNALLDTLGQAGTAGRILAILLIAVAAHLLALAIRRVAGALLAPGGSGPGGPARRRPKLASVGTLVSSTVTFAIYFVALGMILGQLGIDPTAYFATATVIGLAVGFGSQGLVQDIVIGLTLIFSDVLDVGDVADVGGQTGRVESIGLRFTVLRTLVDQRVFVPNRNVGQINRYRNGYVRAYVDAQHTERLDGETVAATVQRTAEGMHRQHRGIILAPPEPVTPAGAADGPWSFTRVKIKIWPGQNALLETVLRQRLVAALKQLDPDYADWMVTVTYRAEPAA